MHVMIFPYKLQGLAVNLVLLNVSAFKPATHT